MAWCVLRRLPPPPLLGQLPTGVRGTAGASGYAHVPQATESSLGGRTLKTTLPPHSLFTQVLCWPHLEALGGTTALGPGSGPGPLPSVESGLGQLTSSLGRIGLMTPALTTSQGRVLAWGSHGYCSPRKPTAFSCFSFQAPYVPSQKLSQSLLEPLSFLGIPNIKA